jgi:hypothetical protein
VLAVEVGSGVHPVKMDKPTKELDLTGEFALPNELGTCQFDVVSMEETVSTTTRKGGEPGQLSRLWSGESRSWSVERECCREY